MSKPDITDQMSEWLIELTDALQKQGATLPMHVVVVATNGDTTVMRLGEDGNVRLLCEHSEPAGLMFPINFMFVDGKGEAYRAVVATEGRPRLIQ